VTEQEKAEFIARYCTHRCRFLPKLKINPQSCISVRSSKPNPLVPSWHHSWQCLDCDGPLDAQTGETYPLPPPVSKEYSKPCFTYRSKPKVAKQLEPKTPAKPKKSVKKPVQKPKITVLTISTIPKTPRKRSNRRICSSCGISRTDCAIRKGGGTIKYLCASCDTSYRGLQGRPKAIRLASHPDRVCPVCGKPTDTPRVPRPQGTESLCRVCFCQKKVRNQYMKNLHTTGG
jgi:hypothetical protein